MPAFADGIDARLTTEHEHDEGQSPQGADSQIHAKFAHCQDTGAKGHQVQTQNCSGDRQAAVAALRIAPSTGSCPPSELASAASARTCASSKPGIGRTFVTLSVFCVSVPVLSAHKTSVVPASSTAESRVGRTPRFAKARAPSAAARLKVAGSATGIEAR